jgi:N-acylneuraminate cytidylyltransferase
MSAVCVIPARSGSRRIEHKNRKLFHGKPVIQYSIEAAKASRLFDEIIVSTDDQEIMTLAYSLGVHAGIRTDGLERDEVGTQEVMRDVLEAFKDIREHACCVYACAPMMTAEDLIRAAAWLTVSEGQGYAHIPGWFYFAKTQTFLDDVPIEHSAPMTSPAERYVDINTSEDWVRAELMYAAWRRRLEGDTDGVEA